MTHPIDYRRIAERLAYQVVLAERHPGPGIARVVFSNAAATGDRTSIECHRLIVEAESRYPSEVPNADTV